MTVFPRADAEVTLALRIAVVEASIGLREPSATAARIGHVGAAALRHPWIRPHIPADERASLRDLLLGHAVADQGPLDLGGVVPSVEAQGRDTVELRDLFAAVCHAIPAFGHRVSSVEIPPLVVPYRFVLEEARRVRPRDALDGRTLVDVFTVDDAVTRVDFVVSVLMDVFALSMVEAVVATSFTDAHGAAEIGRLPFAEAEARIAEVTRQARTRDFPLSFVMLRAAAAV